MVQWKTMALWFSLESGCFFSICHIPVAEWEMGYNYKGALLLFQAHLWPLRGWLHWKKNMQRLSWCKSVQLCLLTLVYIFAGTFLLGPIHHRNRFFRPHVKSLYRMCPHVLRSCNYEHFCMQVTLNRNAVARNFCILQMELKPCWTKALVCDPTTYAAR